MSTNDTLTAQTGSAGSAVLVLGRILLSLMFILAGFSKLTAIGGTAGWFASLGLPVPTLTAVVVGLVELIGGVAVLVGFQTRIAAAVLALFTVGATLIAHMNIADQMQQLLFMKNLSVTGGLLVLAVFGPGALSVDAKRG